MVGRMDVGALIFPTDVSIRPDVLGRELEARGFESLWVVLSREHRGMFAGIFSS